MMPPGGAHHLALSIEHGLAFGTGLPRIRSPRREDWWPRTAASLAFAQLAHDPDDHDYPVRDARRFPWVTSGPGEDVVAVSYAVES